MNYLYFIFLLVCHPLLAQKEFTVIAHRGASGYLPEHTLESASLAHSFNVDYIEADVVLTKDNQLIVLHDIHLDLTTNVHEVFPEKKRDDGKWYAIDLTLTEIKMLKIGERLNKNGKAVYSQRFPSQYRKFSIPTLEEFIQLIQGLNHSRKKNIGIYIEIKKPEFHQQEKKNIVPPLMKLLEKYGYEQNQKAILQCFYPPTLQLIHQKYKTKIPLVLLIAENTWGESSINYDKLMTEKALEKVSQYAYGIGPWIGTLMDLSQRNKKNLVKNAHKFGLKVHAYTHRSDAIPNKKFTSDLEFLKYLKNELKLDGLFSDFSDKVMILKND